ncbi:MAG: N-acetylneuraminate synthase family protein [Flavobacteriales bacterium]|nr:N-acetylneuraminate synthase family protein [Flavobacteriales bacterium]
MKMKLADLLVQRKADQFSLQKPYMIAEAGVNHEGSMDLAKRLIQEAAEGGAHAIKFQTYKAETIASKESPSYWDTSKEATKSQFELFKKYDKFWKSEYEALKKCCDEFDIEFLSTPFDVTSADFLNDLMDVYKISSSDLNNLPFVEYLCQFDKPILLSTGASYLWETKRTVELIDKHNIPLCLMHCVLNYPTLNENANLGMIKDLQRHFPDKVIGYSDHTLPEDMQVCVNATLLGAEIIEKHFTHNKTLPGNDHYHAMDKEDLLVYNQKIESLFNVLGSFDKKPLETEYISRQNARRSLVAKREIPKGTIISMDDLTWKRPASGISPSEIKQIIGKKSLNKIPEDSVLKNFMFE